ncbi:hypothetical protein AMAG_01990 [Allomyces macrogynus ATCC 38327]|uniref:Uncharacterized protein n=1 Tax=Allomyces macrogynus (strain ATCC 38327) TaxID=578462 RepID=A0A0L0S1B9_ALLM3|nr:hypothetical protein AMAG_01990 [Allomyces macrogynus ATCC 38327]|eukprot:KNE56154.1 hypothetical protein AMAG_01990 [Allomyces macrogynus ATCC 38327]
MSTTEPSPTALRAESAIAIVGTALSAVLVACAVVVACIFHSARRRRPQPAATNGTKGIAETRGHELESGRFSPPKKQGKPSTVVRGRSTAPMPGPVRTSPVAVPEPAYIPAAGTTSADARRPGTAPRSGPPARTLSRTLSGRSRGGPPPTGPSGSLPRSMSTSTGQYSPTLYAARSRVATLPHVAPVHVRHALPHAALARPLATIYRLLATDGHDRALEPFPSMPALHYTPGSPGIVDLWGSATAPAFNSLPRMDDPEPLTPHDWVMATFRSDFETLERSSALGVPDDSGVVDDDDDVHSSILDGDIRPASLIELPSRAASLIWAPPGSPGISPLKVVTAVSDVGSAVQKAAVVSPSIEHPAPLAAMSCVEP